MFKCEIGIFKHTLLPTAEEDTATTMKSEFEKFIPFEWLWFIQNVYLVKLMSFPIFVVLNPFKHIRIKFVFIKCTMSSIGNLRVCLVWVVEMLLFIVQLIGWLYFLTYIKIISNIPWPCLTWSNFFFFFFFWTDTCLTLWTIGAC